MNTFDIFVDSGANIPEQLLLERDIRVIPFSFTVDGEEHSCMQEGKKFEEVAKRFYDDMRTGADIKTSLICADTFENALRPSLNAGKDVILLTISSGISGTHQQATIAAHSLNQQFEKVKVYVIDSANASMGTGLLALKVADLRDLGENALSCAEWATTHAYEMNSYLTVGDLKYLRKTGRISTTLAIAGTLLNMKPILRADGGAHAKIVFDGKQKGRKKALFTLAQIYKERAEDFSKPVAVMHADCEEDAKHLISLLKEAGASEIITGYYDLCTGTHVGPGTVALFFTGKDRRPTPAVEKEKSPLHKPLPTD